MAKQRPQKNQQPRPRKKRRVEPVVEYRDNALQAQPEIELPEGRVYLSEEMFE